MIEYNYAPLLKVVNNYEIKIPFFAWIPKDKKLVQLIAKCLNYFFCVLKFDDYMSVSTCKMGKQI